MITYVRLENFKAFSRLELSDLPRIVLLGGVNNVGKTSVLEALFLFLDRSNPNFLVRQFAWRGMSAFLADPSGVWAPFFRNYNVQNPLIIAVKNSASEETLELRDNRGNAGVTVTSALPELVGESREASVAQAVASALETLDITVRSLNKRDQIAHLSVTPDGLAMRVEYMEPPPQPAVFLGSGTRIEASEDAFRFGRLDLRGDQQAAVEFLQTVDARLRGLSVIPLGDRAVIHADIGMGRKVPVPFLGEGVARMLSLLLAIATTPRGVVLIDEIENGLHYSIVQQIWKGIGQATARYDCQLFATTHSRECLYSAVDGLAEAGAESAFRYIRLDKPNGEIDAKHYSHAMVAAAREREWEIR